MPGTSMVAPGRLRRRVFGAVVVACSAALAGCSLPDSMSDTSERANAAIMKAQVSLMQAADTTRANVEARAAEEAEASLETARHGEIGGGAVVQGGGPAVDLGDRYATRREADGSWAVYDVATGRTMRRDSPGESLGKDDAQGFAAELNAGESARTYAR